jgi:hypothetical protein
MTSHPRHPSPLALLLAIAAGAAWADEASPDLGRIEDALLLPEANLNWGDGRIHLHPKAFAHLGYGSRRFSDGSTDRGPDWGGVAGLELRWSPVREQMLAADGLAGVDGGDQQPGRDESRGIARLSWLRRSPLVNLSTGAQARIENQELVYAGLDVRLIHQEIDASAWYEGAHLWLGVSPSLARERYLDSGAVGEGDQRDWRSFQAPLELRWRGNATWVAQAGWLRYDFQDGSPNPDGNCWRLRAGLAAEPHDAWSIDLRGGVSLWRWNGPYGGDPRWGGEAPTVLEADLRCTWEASERLLLVATALRQAIPGVDSTTAIENRAGVETGYRLDQRWRALLFGGLVRVDEIDGSQAPPERRNGWNLVASCEYEYQHGRRLRAFVSADSSQMRYGPSYDRWSTGLQAYIIF